MHSGNPYACFLANPLRIGTGILTMLGLVVAGWPSPAAAKSTAAAGATADEDLEDIEILRFVEMGMMVRMIQFNSVGIAIDTPEDLERAKQHLARNQH